MNHDSLDIFFQPDAEEQVRLQRLARKEDFAQKADKFSTHVGKLLSLLSNAQTTDNELVVAKIVDLINADTEHTLVDSSVKQGGLTAEILRTTVQRLAVGILEQQRIIEDRYDHLGFVDKRNALSKNGEYQKIKLLEKTLASIKIYADKYTPEVPGSGEIEELFVMDPADKDF
jgi:hypothetical protein